MSIVDLAEPRDEGERMKLDVPPLVGNLQDLARSWENFFGGKPLCRRCRGTGNELYSMYKACEDCGGSGEDQSGEVRRLWAV